MTREVRKMQIFLAIYDPPKAGFRVPKVPYWQKRISNFNIPEAVPNTCRHARVEHVFTF